MKWVWMFVTIVLAVTGVIGGYNTVENLIKGSSSTLSLVGQVALAIVCLVLAPKAYAKAKAA